MDREIGGLELKRVIGRGGSALVYEAYDPRHGRQVAVKVLELPGVEDRRRRAFRRELQAMGRLGDHPHVVDVFDSGFTVDGSPYLVMPLIEGGTVAQRIRDGELFSVEQVLDFGVKIGSALETAHRRGILHCDIKPSNLFLGAFSTPLLGDLGISSISEAGLTTTSQLSLTIMYAAPEIIENEPHSVQSDVYSLGASIFALIDMAPPFTGESTAALIRNILSVDTKPQLSRSVPEGLEAAIGDMMAIDPADRPQSALEVVHRFQSLQEALGLPVTEASVAAESVEVAVDPPTGLPGTADADTRSRGLGVAASVAPTESKRRGLLVALAAALLVLGAIVAVIATRGTAPPETTIEADQPAATVAAPTSVEVPTTAAPTPIPASESQAGAETATAIPDSTPTETPAPAAADEPVEDSPADDAASDDAASDDAASDEASASGDDEVLDATAVAPEPEPAATAEPSGPVARINGSIARTDGAPADSVEVDLFAQLPDGLRGDFLEGAFTDALGNFSFDATVPGCYVLTYIAPEGFIIVGGDAFLEAPLCIADASTQTVAVEITEQRPPEASIVGRVIRADTFAAVTDAAVDLFVANDDGSRGSFVAAVTTDGEGNYRFDVATGCYVVTFVAPDGLMLVGGDEYLNMSAGCLNAGESVTIAAQVQ